jgi:hypothetical protein
MQFPFPEVVANNEKEVGWKHRVVENTLVSPH